MARKPDPYLIKRIQRLEAVLGSLIVSLPDLGVHNQEAFIEKLIKPIRLPRPKAKDA